MALLLRVLLALGHYHKSSWFEHLW